MLSIISVIASTLKGVEYITKNGKEIVCYFINLFKILYALYVKTREVKSPLELSISVNLRFTVAIL